MTPKEKAIELIDKFKEIIPAEYDHIDGGYDLLNLEFNARDCARLAVDEMMEVYVSACVAMGMSKEDAEKQQSK
jgi:hypothetical protein